MMEEVSVTLAGLARIDFDRRVVRKTIRKAAGPVRVTARRLAGQRDGGGRSYRVWGDLLHRASVAGAAPAKLTGQFQRSIDIKIVNDGFAAFIGPNLNRAFYARFLAGGTRDMAARPVMDQALEVHRGPIAALLAAALPDALVPRDTP